MIVSNSIPQLSVDLIEQLDRQYPHRCPKRADSAWDIAAYAGKRELIDTLLEIHRKETNQPRS
jgi:hypothetical protein